MRIWQIPALAFVHPFDVHELFEHVALLLPPSVETAELLDYFQRAHVGRTLLSGYLQLVNIPYCAVELSLGHTLRDAPDYKRRGSMAP